MTNSDPFTPTPVSPFAHGPYTDDMTVIAPAPLSQETRNRNIRTAAWVALFLIAIGCVLGATLFAPESDNPPRRESLPICELEDGSTQRACIWPYEGGQIVNLDYGRYSYSTSTNMVTDHGEGYGR